MGKKKTTYNTTGGAGYIPPVTSPVSLTQGLRDRAYHRVRPSGYTYDNAKRFFTDKSRLFEDPNTEGLWGMYTGQDSIIANTTQAPDEMPKGRPLTQEEFIALGRPADDYTEGELAKYAVKDIVIPSRSKEGAYELAYPNKKGTVPHLPYNANDVPESSWPHSHQLGTFHQVKRQDGNGLQVTYEDTWDINPFKGQSATDDSSWKDFINIGRKLGIDKFGNIVPFGKPFEIYGKQYYDKNGKPIKQKADGGFLPNTPWDNLTLAEKAAMIKVAVNNGILNIPDIRQKYNEFAEGGYVPSDYIKGRITQYEGKAMTGAIDPLSGKYGKNNSFEYEADAFYKALPPDIREKVLANPQLADHLYSYSYNVGAGNFKKRTVPMLQKYYKGEATIEDVENSMWATGDKKLRGLQRRRAEERAGVRSALGGGRGVPYREIPYREVPYQEYAYIPQEEPVVTDFVPSNPKAFFSTLDEIKAASTLRDDEISNTIDGVYAPKSEEPIDSSIGTDILNSFFDQSLSKEDNDFLNALQAFTGRGYAGGGSIHIKPSHRGRLTDLKKRTGKTEAELYNDGNPAHKKMVVFARNSRKWKHGDGGNLFSGEENHSNRIVTTGGAGYIPPTNVQGVTSQVAKGIRKRLYNNLYPMNYTGDFGSVEKRLFTTLIKNEPEWVIDENGYDVDRDDIWAEYLQIPKKERHILPGKALVEDAVYTPRMSKDKNVKYKRINSNTLIDNSYIDDNGNITSRMEPLREVLISKDIPFLARYGELPNIGKNIVTEGDSYTRYFGGFTLGSGYDEKGHYYSIYDKWDLDPGYSSKVKDEAQKSNGEDKSMGIGKPIEFYDRIYLDDYYGVKEPTHATYLPEITVTGKKKKALGGNLFDGTSQPSQKMQIGLNVQGWPNYTTEQIIANGERIQQQRKAIQDAYLNFVTESNDATAVSNGRPQNKHLEERGIKGAEAHRAWEKEHPNLTAWGNVLSAVPFAVAAAPAGAWGLTGISALGDAAASTSVGQGITNFLAPIATTSYAGATVPQWLDLGLTSGFGAHGVQTAVDEGGISPTTALELAPMLQVVKPMYNAGHSGYSAARAFVNDVKANQGFAVSSPRIGKIFGKDAGQFTAWIPTDRPWSEGLSWINTGAPTTEGLPIQYITSKHSGEARKLYDAAIRKAKNEGHPGIVTGSSLISAPKTYSTLEHYYPSRIKLDDMGHWSNDSMTGLFEGPRKTVYTLDDFLKTVSENPTERVHFLGAPRYRLETPSTAFAEGTPAAEWASSGLESLRAGQGTNSKLYPNFNFMTRDEKIQYLKAQQDLAMKVYQARDLDAVRLTKDRLRNGGFDRLKEAMYGDVTGKSQETLGIMLNDPNKNIVFDWVSKHAEDILSKHPTKGTAAEVQNKENWKRLVGSNAGAGVLSRFYSWFKDAPQKLQGLQKANRGAAHEFAHYTYMPFGFPKGFNPKASPLAEYFTGGTRFPNSGEVMARGTQLKNYFGLKEGEELTPEMYRYAQRHYMKDVGNNNMKEFFQSGDPEYPYFPLFLKWINKNAPMIGVGTTLTGTVLNSTNNEQNR